MRIDKNFDVTIQSLAMEDRRLLFAASRNEVAATFIHLNSTEKKRWASSAQMLVEILNYSSKRPLMRRSAP